MVLCIEPRKLKSDGDEIDFKRLGADYLGSVTIQKHGGYYYETECCSVIKGSLSRVLYQLNNTSDCWYIACGPANCSNYCG